MSHRGGPDHADVTSSWFGSLAPLVLLCRVWRMRRLGFSGRGPGVHVPSAPLRLGCGAPCPRVCRGRTVARAGSSAG